MSTTSTLTKNLIKAHGPSSEDALVSFTTANTSAPTVVERHGVASVSRSGVGVFLVTLSQTAKAYHTFVSKEGAAALDANQVIVSAKSVSARTVTITVTDGAGAAADTTALTINLLVRKRISA
jgi:hypothetical protein